MNGPDDTQLHRSSRLSREAMVGLGITIGAFGFMFLLLGWAQTMRLEKSSGFILLVIGGAMFVVGGILALSDSKRRS